jgi:hypothetical protein
MSNLVRWGSYDASTAKAEKEEMAKGGGGQDFMKLQAGRNVVRVLPPAPGKRSPFRVVHQHFVRLPTSPNPVVFVCPRMETKSECPLCTQAGRLRSSGNEADREKAWELMPKRRVFCSVIDRANPEAGPKVLAFGKMVHEELVSLREDEDTGGDFSHPLTGYDVIILREGTGKNDTSYKVRRAKGETPLSPDAAEMDRWADAMPDLDQFGKVKPLEEIMLALGIDPERARAERAVVVEQKAAATKAKGQRKAATASDDDDDMPY